MQRDILPIVEGTTVNSKYGMVRTDHILFIAAGAFHVSKPSDLIPELQGRFPIRVELEAARPRRVRPHPDRAEERAHQAVHRAHGDRGRDARVHARRHRADRRARDARQRAHREHRRAAAAHRDRAAARRSVVSRAGDGRPIDPHRRRVRRSHAGRHRAGATTCRGTSCDASAAMAGRRPPPSCWSSV